MKNETKTRKGFFSLLRESFSKTGGCCCGPGETCDGSGPSSEPKPRDKSVKTNPAEKSGSK